MASYYLRMSISYTPGGPTIWGIGPVPVVRGKQIPVKESIEEIVNQWLQSFNRIAGEDMNVVSVKLDHGVFMKEKRKVLLVGEFQKELILDLVWSSLEEHYLNEMIKKPKTTKKSPAAPIAKKDFGRL